MGERGGAGPVGGAGRSGFAAAAEGPFGPGPPTLAGSAGAPSDQDRSEQHCSDQDCPDSAPASPPEPDAADHASPGAVDRRAEWIEQGRPDDVGGEDVDGMERPFAAGGTMGRLMAAMDWAGTPLGPIRGWGASLRTSVGILLESRFPMVITWGPELAYLYNDGAIPILGRNHPGALGRPFREVWPEIWDLMRPMIGQVMSGGGATWSQDQQLLLLRHGYLEESYFTFSFSPIRDVVGGGGVAGVLTTVQETTRQMLDTRRLACLRELATALAHRHSLREVCTRAARVLGRCGEDIPFAVILLRDLRARRSPPRPVASCGLADGGLLDLLAAAGPDGPVPEIGAALSSGRTMIVEGLSRRTPLRLADGRPAPASALVVPFARTPEGQPVGVLLAAVSDRLDLDHPYQEFVELVGGQISTAAASARLDETRREQAADARHRALHDELTGLPNRAVLIDRLRRALARSRGGRRGRTGSVGLLFVDLDGFKAVNDTLGHQAGDDLLREVATRLRRAVRPGDVVARLAGDEFAVLCADMGAPASPGKARAGGGSPAGRRSPAGSGPSAVAGSAAIETVADRIVAALTIPVGGGGRAMTVTASVGVALAVPGQADPDAVLHAADIAMYAAKRQGRDRYLVFDEAMREEARRGAVGKFTGSKQRC